MKRAFAWQITIGLAIPQISTAEGNNTLQDQEDVLAAIKIMTSAFESNDIEQVMETYESVATVAFEPASPVGDPKQMKKMFSAMASLNPEFTYVNGHEVIIAGDFAMHIAPWEMSGQTPDGQSVEQSVLSVAMLRRQADGSWRMIIDNPHGARLLSAGN